MNKHAVLFTILLALFITLSSVSFAFYKLYDLNRDQYINSIFMKYFVITRVFKEHYQKHSSDTMLEANLASYDLYFISNTQEANLILREGKVLKREGFQTLSESLFYDKMLIYKQKMTHDLRATMLHFGKHIYFYIESANNAILLEDRQLKNYHPLNLITTYIIIVSSIIIAFVLILRRIQPLRVLRKKIRAFGRGKLDISFKMKGEDEIAVIANELESTRIKIQTMIESRTLFMRNIMHELKTPIAKGRIASTMLQTQKARERFENIFIRMENLISDFALIEEVGSGFEHLEKSEYRYVDLIDGAIDMAMVDRDRVEIHVDGTEKLEADYKLFATAIKNMIDNAMKYSPDQHITITLKEKELCFSSKGESLNQPLSYYVQPFTKSHKAESSFGLGLYIVDSILKAHDMVLAYEYHDGINCFLFVPTPPKDA